MLQPDVSHLMSDRESCALSIAFSSKHAIRGTKGALAKIKNLVERIKIRFSIEHLFVGDALIVLYQSFVFQLYHDSHHVGPWIELKREELS